LFFWLFYDKAYNKGFFKDDPSAPKLLFSAIAIGWGFGFTHLMISYVSLLFHATGPSFLGAPACTTFNLFYVSGLLTLATSLLHVLWNVLAFDGFVKKSWWRVAIVVVSHMVLSFLTVGVNGKGGNCALSIGGAYMMLLLVSVVVWRVITTSGTMLIPNRASQ